MENSMNSEDPFGLRPLWEALEQLYIEYAAFCQANGLRHYAAFGTALGAFRHGGFIPWDDDMDVYMPRNDYEQFFAICNSTPQKRFRAVNVWNDPNHRLLFGKLESTDQSLISATRARIGQSNCDFAIDIFPLDGLPFGNLRFKFWILERAVRRRMGRYLPTSRMRRKNLLSLEQWGRNWPYDESHYVQCYQENLCKIKDRLYTREMFGTAKQMPFDRIQVAVPEDTIGYLKAEFGPDYMTPPPPEKQVPSHSLRAAGVLFGGR